MAATAFGEFLHTVRKRTKGTQVARAAGISYVYLLDLEKGARPVPSDTVLMALANNLPFNPGEREHFFDLAAAENGCAPLDSINMFHGIVPPYLCSFNNIIHDCVLKHNSQAIEMIDRLLCLFRTNSAHRTHFVFTRDRGRHFLFFFSFALPCRVASVVVFSHTG